MLEILDFRSSIADSFSIDCQFHSIWSHHEARGARFCHRQHRRTLRTEFSLFDPKAYSVVYCVRLVSVWEHIDQVSHYCNQSPSAALLIPISNDFFSSLVLVSLAARYILHHQHARDGTTPEGGHSISFVGSDKEEKSHFENSPVEKV